MSDVEDAGHEVQIFSSSSRRRQSSAEAARRYDESEAIPALVQKARRQREEREESPGPQWSRPRVMRHQAEQRAAEIYQQQRVQQALAWVENKMAWERYEYFQQCWAENVKNYLWDQYQQTQMENACHQAKREHGHY